MTKAPSLWYIVMLEVNILSQPNCVSCGATSLHALYQYFGDHIAQDEVIAQAPSLEAGGTLIVLLGTHALHRGYKATLNSLNMHVIDPTWFHLTQDHLLRKLCEQLNHSDDAKVISTTKAYITFLELGGEITFVPPTLQMLAGILDKGQPILCGLSATYLYQNMRDYTNDEDRAVYDEWKGKPSGHILVLRGCSLEKETVHIADPYIPHPLSRSHYYSVPYAHWLYAHLLGCMTYDTELLALSPP